MTFLRNLRHDLVDKKLWPLVVILVAALVAVPLVLGGGGDEASTPVPAPATTGPTASTAQAPATAEVAVAVEEPVLHRRKGKTRDPFKQQFAPKTVTATGEQPKPTTPESQGTTKTTPSTGGSGGTTTTPTTTTPTTPEVDPLDVYRVALRFGKPGKRKIIRDIARLSPLPNPNYPFFIFLGVLSGGKKAVFLVSSDATATGDGTCRPSKTNCETVEMEAGDTEFFDLETAGGVVQYQLDLITVKRRTAESAAAVAAAAARHARYLRLYKPRQTKPAKKTTPKADPKTETSPADDLGTDAYRWDEDRGVLVRRRTGAAVAMDVGEGVMSVLRDAPDVVVLADGMFEVTSQAAAEAPAVVGTP